MRRGLAALVIALAMPACLVKPEHDPIVHVKSFVAVSQQTEFTTAAFHVGDAVVLHVTCVGGTAIPTFSVAAPSWELTELGPIVADPNHIYISDSFGAVAPDTVVATFTVTTVPPCAELVILGDEFTHNDPRGGATTFDAYAAIAGDGESVAIQTKHDGDAVWAAMTTAYSAMAGPGFEQSAIAMGNPAEYRLDNGPAGSIVDASFVGGMPPHSITAISIRSQ